MGDAPVPGDSGSKSKRELRAENEAGQRTKSPLAWPSAVARMTPSRLARLWLSRQTRLMAPAKTGPGKPAVHLTGTGASLLRVELGFRKRRSHGDHATVDKPDRLVGGLWRK